MTIPSNALGISRVRQAGTEPIVLESVIVLLATKIGLAEHVGLEAIVGALPGCVGASVMLNASIQEQIATDAHLDARSATPA